jgi:hypothetical protein
MGLNHLAELEAIATEAAHMRCQINLPEARQTLERLILRSLWQLLHNFDPATCEADGHRLERLIELGQQMNLGLSLAQAQELYFYGLNSWIIPEVLNQVKVTQAKTASASNSSIQTVHLRSLLRLGQKLAVDVNSLLAQLSG